MCLNSTEGPLWFFNVPKIAVREEKMKEKNEELKAVSS